MNTQHAIESIAAAIYCGEMTAEEARTINAGEGVKLIAQMTAEQACVLSPAFRRQYGFEAWLEISIRLWKRMWTDGDTKPATEWDFRGCNLKGR